MVTMYPTGTTDTYYYQEVCECDCCRRHRVESTATTTWSETWVETVTQEIEVDAHVPDFAIEYLPEYNLPTKPLFVSVAKTFNRVGKRGRQA